MKIEKVTEWVSGGDYAVAVEVDAKQLAERPGEFFFTPATVRRLERIRKEAEAGNVAALKEEGKVYQLMGDPR